MRLPFRLMVLLAGCLILGWVAPASAEDAVSAKTFPPVALANHFICTDSTQSRDLACGFLFRHDGKIYAVSAKHILAAMKIEGLDRLSLSPAIKEWLMFSKEDRRQHVKLERLLNEAPQEKLSDKHIYTQDWLVFAVAENTSQVQPLEYRATPLKPNETLYVVGWTNHQTNGAQRVYEWKYLKTIGTRVLVEPVIVPKLMGGLSGAPVVDADGRVVAIVSNGTINPDDGKKYFSPCSLTGLVDYLDHLPSPNK